MPNTLLFFKGTDTNSLITDINTALSSIVNKLSENKLHLNTPKSFPWYFIIVPKLLFNCVTVVVFYRNVLFPFSHAPKFLDISIDNNLSCSIIIYPDIDAICHKISKGTDLPYGARGYLPKYALLSIYKVIVFLLLSNGTLLYWFLFPSHVSQA